jgi:hypothetical protein
VSLIATDLHQDLERRFAQAVEESFAVHAQVGAELVDVAHQERHLERMASCTATATGEGWIGTLSLLVPEEGAQSLCGVLLEKREEERLRGSHVAEALGALTVGAALGFGESFADENSVIVGPPTMVMGDRLSVAFPWGQSFETRLSFVSEKTAFWAVLRLSHIEKI